MRKETFQLVTLHNGADNLRTHDLHADALPDFANDERRKGRTVCLLANKSVPALLAALGENAVDRHAKHVSRQLGLLLLGQRKIPIVRGTYTDPVRALDSIRKFFATAASVGEHNLYFIGLDDHILDGVRRLLNHKAAHYTARNKPATEARPVLRDDDELARLFPGDSIAIRLFRHQLLQAVEDNGPVLLTGEVGTGKNRAAEFICRRSRSTSPQHLNSATLNRGQLDEKLRHAGYLHRVIEKSADTFHPAPIILDEIATLAPRDQAVLRNRLPDDDAPAAQRARAMLVLTTNRDLREMLATRTFDEALYYLLERYAVRIPPLAERPDDIPAIAQAMWKTINVTAAPMLPNPVIQLLREQRWPGNLRELKTILIKLHRALPAPRPAPGLLDRILRALLHEAGRTLRPTPRETSAAASAERLEHLRRCSDAIHLTSTLVARLAAFDNLRSRTARALIHRIRAHLRDLDTLCQNPARFSGQSICLALQQTAATLETTLDDLPRHPAPALRRLRTEHIPSLARIPPALLEETNRLLRGI